MVKSSELSYQRGEVKINVGQAQKIANDVEYANKVLSQKIEILEYEINGLKDNPENKGVSSEETSEACIARIEQVSTKIEEIKPTIAESAKSSEELKKILD